ncbi:RNA polymerase sigma factor [Rhizobium sp. LjRoot254]|uniref:RNA polymerase sigma factor n=1 Tax=Rhizobium sp. LjRoot254 TaxID=3342297 RepID=UPI003ED12D6F
MTAAAERRAETAALSDVELMTLARAGDETAMRVIVRRHNQQLFRLARAVLRNDSEAEDVVQATYVSAFTNLTSFRNESQLATWLTRIALNEALGRLRKARRTTPLEELDMPSRSRSANLIHFPTSISAPDPEAEASRNQARRLLERAVDSLPLSFRPVFILRDVHGMNIEETAVLLDLKPETVKTRLFRARKLMREAIEKELTGSFSALFPFDGARCAAMADRVVAALK